MKSTFHVFSIHAQSIQINLHSPYILSFQRCRQLERSKDSKVLPLTPDDMPLRTQYQTFTPYFKAPSYYIDVQWMQDIGPGSAYAWRWTSTRQPVSQAELTWAPDDWPKLAPDLQPIGRCICIVLAGNNLGWTNCRCRGEPHPAICVYESDD